MSTSNTPAPRRSWLDSLRVYFEPASLRMLALGFAAGLPLLLVLGTLSFRLREAGINRSTIGFLTWVGLAYGFKWVWAPLVDRLPIPILTRLLGRRRSWLLLAQCGVVVGLLAMGALDPQQNLTLVAVAAVAVAFSSATQDIALDAFRIESAATEKQAAMAASYQTGYRLAMIWAGAGVLWVASYVQGATPGYSNDAWHVAYTTMACSMAVGMLTVLFSKEPVAMPQTVAKTPGEWLHTTLIAPFVDFFQRYRWHAVLILALISVYRISDIVMGIMANPFYVDMHYTKDEVATVTKVFGVIMTLLGAYIGGILSMRFGVMRILILGSVLSASSHLLFAWLAGHGHDVNALILVVSADNLSGGIASAAFIAYLSSLTNIKYSATQYALFSSLMLLLPKALGGGSGAFVDAFGYQTFFICTALMGIPVIVLVWIAGRVLRHK